MWVPGINFGGPVHPDLDPRTLTGPELCAIREAFYELLSKFVGYEIAMVGWDPEENVDERQLRLRLEESGTDGLGGLVLRAPLAMDLRLESFVEPFADCYVRLPYEEPRVWWI